MEEEEKLLPPCVDGKSAIPDRGFLRIDHFYMNLPMDAVEFLDVFRGIYANTSEEERRVLFRRREEDGVMVLPMIHVNGFTVEEEREKALEYFVNRIGTVLKTDFRKEDVETLHKIRGVSAVSNMYCVSFRLREDIAFKKNTE